MTPTEPGPTADTAIPDVLGEFRVLSADDPAQAAEWLHLWHRWPDSEIMAHPSYAKLFSRPGDEVLAATYVTPRGGVLYPLILRPLNLESWAPPGRGTCDLTTPYGYGGPFAWEITPAEATDFWGHLERWARGREVVTAFARLSVFPDQLLPFDGETVLNGPNVVRRLDLSDEAMWNDYEPKVRQNVRRARSRGCTLRVDETGERLDDFHRVYTSTMERRNADAKYFFGKDFFEAIVRDLAGGFAFFHVMHGDRVVSSELVLLSHRNAYFFLGGTLAEAFDLRPNDFLQHETFLWCRGAGKEQLVLGGGYKGSEGLLKYKKSFAPSGEVPFLVGIRTYDDEAARDLVEARSRWERSTGREWTPEAGFFPAYRSETGERRQAA
jgi:hypothetical protein